MKWLSRAALASVFALGAGVVAVGLKVDAELNEPFGDFEQPALLEYQPRMSSRELAEILEEQGVVRSSWHFLLVRGLQRERILQAGEYAFSKPASVWDVFDTIAEGRVYLRPLTIPEGLNRFEIADLVEAAGYGTAAEFLEAAANPTPVLDLFPEAESLEGCLFPETYLLPKNATANLIIELMIQNFRSFFEPAASLAQTQLSDYSTLILASLIEKETGVPEERELVSSVFHNRLERGMRLQCDPTIIYGLLLEDRYRGKIYASDLKDPTPYNTYVHAGFPPGPIANPGRAAIEAALQPADTDYLFFVAKSRTSPRHVFTETLRQHNRAVAAYRRSGS